MQHIDCILSSDTTFTAPMRRWDFTKPVKSVNLAMTDGVATTPEICAKACGKLKLASTRFRGDRDIAGFR
jgi:hypothetical protein